MDYISWGENRKHQYQYKLNRENLILEKTMFGRKKPDTIRECKVYSRKEFLEIQTKILSNYQKNQNKKIKSKKDFETKLKKNKI